MRLLTIPEELGKHCREDHALHQAVRMYAERLKIFHQHLHSLNGRVLQAATNEIPPDFKKTIRLHENAINQEKSYLERWRKVMLEWTRAMQVTSDFRQALHVGSVLLDDVHKRVLQYIDKFILALAQTAPLYPLQLEYRAYLNNI